MLGSRDFVATPRGGLRRHGLEVVDVVQEHVLDLRDRGIDVARHGEIEHTQRAPATPRNHRPDAFPGHHRVGRGGRAERDVDRRKVWPGLLQRHRPSAQPLGDRACALLGAIRDQRDLHTLVAQAGGRELGHVSRAENQRVPAGEIAEDFFRDLRGGRRSGRRSHPQTAVSVRTREPTCRAV